LIQEDSKLENGSKNFSKSKGAMEEESLPKKGTVKRGRAKNKSKRGS
jgi:hypothetical protein